MYSTYTRLRVPVWASARDVIRALYGRMRPDARQHGHRSARHAIIREMLGYHAQAQNLHAKATQ